MTRAALGAAAALLALALTAGGAVLTSAYFNETHTSPQPISVANFASADIKYEGASPPALNSNEFVTVDKPAGVQPGWLLIATIGGESTPTVTAPSGWTVVGSPVLYPGGQVSMRSFWHVATASEPASYTFTLSQKRRASGGMLAYSGVTAANPIERSANATGKTLTATAPQATASYVTRWIATVTFQSKDALTWSADVTERWERPTGGENTSVADAALQVGPTPAATVAGKATQEWVSQTIVLNAAP